MDAEEIAALATSDEARNALLNMLLERVEQAKLVEKSIDTLEQTSFTDLTPQMYVEFLASVPVIRNLLAQSLEMNTRAAHFVGDVDVAKLLAERLAEGE